MQRHMHILLMIMLATADMVDYGQLAEVKELKEYCTPYYARPAIGGKLKKAIVVFRHGDRVPLSASGSVWGERKCVACENSKCSLTKCIDGLLTDLGFQQGRDLGKFIKNNYGSILGEGKGINAYCTDVGRTEATLIAVLSELGMAAVPYKVENSLVLDSACANFRNGLARNIGIKMDYGVFDNYMTSVCGRVSLQCEEENCQIENAGKMVLAQYSNYTKLMEELQRDIVMNVSMFADLASTIIRELDSQANVVLMAAHDSTVSRLLNGLNIQAFNVPSYAGAVFIEMLEDKRGDTIRVIYDGAEQKFGLSKSTKIDKQNFIKYLQNFSSNLSLLQKICHNFNSASADFNGNYRNTILQLLDSSFVRAFNKSNANHELLEDSQASNEQSEPVVSDSDDNNVSLPQALETITKKISHLTADAWRAGQSFLLGWNKTYAPLLGAGEARSGESHHANKKQQIKAVSASAKRESMLKRDGRASRLIHLMNMRSDLTEKHSSSRSAGAKKRRDVSSKKRSKKDKLESSDSCSSTTETGSSGDGVEVCGECSKGASQTCKNNCGPSRPSSCSRPTQCNNETNNSDNCASKVTPGCSAQQANCCPCDAANNCGSSKRKSSCKPRCKKAESRACRTKKPSTAFKCDADVKYEIFPVTSTQPCTSSTCSNPQASRAPSCPTSSPCPLNSIV